MRNRSQRIAVYLGCGCALLLTACGNASGSNPPSTKLVRAPWSEIARGRDSTTLLINTDQGTTDRSSPCFIHYTTRVVSQTSHRITIGLLAPSTEADRLAAQPTGWEDHFSSQSTSRRAIGDRSSSTRSPGTSTVSFPAARCIEAVLATPRTGTAAKSSLAPSLSRASP